jgi:hypothetical protein
MALCFIWETSDKDRQRRKNGKDCWGNHGDARQEPIHPHRLLCGEDVKKVCSRKDPEVVWQQLQEQPDLGSRHL